MLHNNNELEYNEKIQSSTLLTRKIDTLNDTDGGINDIDIKIEPLDIKAEELDTFTEQVDVPFGKYQSNVINEMCNKNIPMFHSYSSDKIGNNKQSRECSNNGQINNSQVFKKTLQHVTAKKYKHQTNITTEKSIVKCLLVDEGCIYTNEKLYENDICNEGFTPSSETNKSTCSSKRSHVLKRKHSLSDEQLKDNVYNKIHTGDMYYMCDVCNREFTQLSHLKTHSCTHAGKKHHKCDVCDKEFTQSGNLTVHKLTHTREKPVINSKYYICDVCNKRFTHSGHLSRHKITHSGEKSYKCDLCNKEFGQSSNLTRHKRTHTGEKPYKCDLCDKQFTESGTLVKHKFIHSGERPFVCDVCNKGFTQSSKLTAHKVTHTGERPYKCDVCNKGFTESGSLLKHKYIHSGERPFICDVCNKGFIQSGALAIHKLTHTGEKPYKCDECNKEFRSSSRLVSHKVTHTVYKCNLCNERFAESSTLTKHNMICEKIHHADDFNEEYEQPSSHAAHKSTGADNKTPNQTLKSCSNHIVNTAVSDKKDRRLNKVTDNNIDINIEDLEIIIEEEDPGIIITYLGEDEQLNVTFEEDGSNVVGEIYNKDHNSEKTIKCNKECTHSLGFHSKCVKLEEIDTYELNLDKDALTDLDNKTDIIEIKIENLEIKIEEPDFFSTYLNDNGKNQQFKLTTQESSSSGHIDNSQVSE